jgi:subtilisin-like proprotein convertase family protein
MGRINRFDWLALHKRSLPAGRNRGTNKSFGRRLHHERLEERYFLSMTPWTPMTLPVGGGLSDAQVDVRATNYDMYSLDVGQVRADYLHAPLNEIAVPNPDGSMEWFTVAETAIMAPELAAQFPDIKTYRGQGIDDPAATISFDITPAGFHAQVLSPNGSFYVDPYYHLNDNIYAVYAEDNTFIVPDFTECLDCDCDDGGDSVKDVTDPDTGAGTDAPIEQAAAAGESTDDPPAGSDIGAGAALAQSSGTVLRTYRLAVAATGEYTAFQGGTVALGQAAIVTAVNRVSGIYESELSIRLQLVANNSQLVYTSASTDPYTNSNPSMLLDENQTNIDSVIGNGNYDIGHVFSTGGGGLAALGVVGKTGQKAEGETGLAAPTGDAFYVDYVAHEMGHQFGGNHPFNGDSGSCSGANRNGPTAYEPGSGSTIMAYAGICGNDDLQPHSDPYFHSVNLDEIITYVDTVIPGVGTRTSNGNSIPTVEAGINYTIPTQTPFTVTAVGSDANTSDVLTYDWEERDLGPQRDLAAADNGSSPLFRSFLPTTSASRTFPQLSDILSNTPNIDEKLPTVPRTMHLRATVRDNRVGGGGFSGDDMTINVVNTGSAFAITGPNTAVNWSAATTQTVTWNVAGTTGNGINTSLVNILLSTDGGNTFPITLAANTPNDGSQAIVVPNAVTSKARIKVQAVGNIFFDISNANFTISTAPGIDLVGSSFTVAPTNLRNANGFVDTSVVIGNQGSTASGAFDVKFYLSDDATINPANDVLLTLDPSSPLYNAAEPSAYHVTGSIAGFATRSANVRLVVPVNDPFRTDNQYFLGMYVDADSNVTETNETNNVNLGVGIDQQPVTYALTFANSTGITIPDSGVGSLYPSTINVSGLVGKIGDVNVSLLGLTHTFPDDLDILLVGPTGQKMILMSDVGGGNAINGINLVLDDQGASALTNSGQLTSGTFRPTNSGTGDTFPSPAPVAPYDGTLAPFNGSNPNGTWSLYVLDDQAANSGSLANGWSLTFVLANSSPTDPVNVSQPAINEDIDTGSNLGRLVSTIVQGSGSTDADGDALGIAVTTVDNAHGQWQYATDLGSGWQDISSTTATTARLLGPSYYVRFNPDPDFNSFVGAAPTFNFKTWDETAGTAGGTADTTTSNAFSTAAAVTKVPVTQVNDAPIFTIPSDPVTANEDDGAVLVSGFATGIAPGPATATDETGQTVAFFVTVAGTTGTLSFDVVPSIDPITGALSFTTAADANGTATIDVVLQDNGSGTPPNVNTSVVQEFTIAVAAVNDEQELVVDSERTVDRGSSVTITNDYLLTYDADDTAADLIYTVTTGPSHGTLLVNGAPVTQFSQQQLNVGLLVYQNDGSANSADSFGFTVDDGKGVASAGTFNIAIRQSSGDFNRDLVVDAADYVLWRKTAGATNVPAYSGADGNGDTTIDQADYTVWQSQFDNTTGVGGGASGERAGSGELGAGSQKTEMPLSETAAIVEQPPALPGRHLALPFSYAPRTSEWRIGAHDHLRLILPAEPGADGVLRDEALVAWLSSRGVGRREYGGATPAVGGGQDCPSDDQVVDDAFDALDAELVALV